MELLEWLEFKKKTESINDDTNQRKRLISISLVAAVCLIMIIIGAAYTALSRTVYFWDDATYWDMSRSVLDGALRGDFWAKVYESICTSDYNYVAALPSALWMRLFGISRTSYVIGLIVMYLVPSSVLTYRLAQKLSKAPLFAYAAAAFIMPAAIFIAASGFADAGGLIFMLGCYNLYYTEKDKSQTSWRCMGIGVLLAAVMLFRRYFAFFSVSFITAMIMDCILFRKRWRNVIITVITSALVLAVFLMPFVTGILLKDYGTLYSGYKFPIYTDIKFITRYFGLVFIAVMLSVPFVAGIRKRDFRPVFMWIQLIVSGAMFMATQTHSIHHILLYIPAFTALTIFMVNNISKHIILLAAAALTAANFISPYIDRVQPSNIQEIKHMSMFPSFSMRPEKREDIEDVLKVKRKLDTFIPEEASCGVLASSFVVNDSILRNVEPSLNLKSSRDGGYITSLPEVDSRDYGRLGEIYNAEYILVAYPAQTHLAPGAQTIVTEGVRSFELYADIALSFEEVPDFDENIGGINMKLYHRIDEVNNIWRNEFEKRLYSR